MSVKTADFSSFFAYAFSINVLDTYFIVMGEIAVLMM